MTPEQLQALREVERAKALSSELSALQFETLIRVYLERQCQNFGLENAKIQLSLSVRDYTFKDVSWTVSNSEGNRSFPLASENLSGEILQLTVSEFARRIGFTLQNKFEYLTSPRDYSPTKADLDEIPW